MQRAKSVSVDKLTEVAKEAAQSVLGDRLKALGGQAEIGFFPDIFIFGLIFPDFRVDSLPVKEMMEISEKMTSAMGDFATNAQPTVQFSKHGATLGYFPPPQIRLAELR